VETTADSAQHAGGVPVNKRAGHLAPVSEYRIVPGGTFPTDGAKRIA